MIDVFKNTSKHSFRIIWIRQLQSDKKVLFNIYRCKILPKNWLVNQYNEINISVEGELVSRSHESVLKDYISKDQFSNEWLIKVLVEKSLNWGCISQDLLDTSDEELNDDLLCSDDENETMR